MASAVKSEKVGGVLADFVAERVGSWPFVLWQSGLLCAWVALNTATIFDFIRWDRYPYILLNLALSFQAAYTGPILLIAQRRKEKIDEKRIRNIEKHLHQVLEKLDVLAKPP